MFEPRGSKVVSKSTNWTTVPKLSLKSGFPDTYVAWEWNTQPLNAIKEEIAI